MIYKVLIKKWNKHTRLFTEESICYCASEKEAQLICDACNKSANLYTELYIVEGGVNM